MNGNIPAAIQRFIEQKGMKQCVVAERMGITPQMLNDMLNGRRLIKPVDISNAAKALEITPNDLFAPDHRSA
jgi:transcriptional regulator with XRE-family HTH domain